MSRDDLLLQRFLDGDLPASEAAALQLRLAHEPALSRQLRELERVGSLLRCWARGVEARGDGLTEPTLAKVRSLARQRARRAALSMGAAALLLASWSWSEAHLPRVGVGIGEAPSAKAGAAIERIEAGDRQARVFVLGRERTPVVWLSDDGADGPDQDPG